MIVMIVPWMMIGGYHDLQNEILMQIRTANDGHDHRYVFSYDLDFVVTVMMEHSPQTAMPMHDAKRTTSIRVLAAASNDCEDHDRCTHPEHQQETYMSS